MKAKFLAAARLEFLEAVRYSERQRKGLGGDFRDAVVDAVRRIDEYLAAWEKLSARTRKCRVYRFPYSVLYEIGATEITIVAVANQHREPDYWRTQL